MLIFFTDLYYNKVTTKYFIHTHNIELWFHSVAVSSESLWIKTSVKRVNVNV